MAMTTAQQLGAARASCFLGLARLPASMSPVPRHDNSGSVELHCSISRSSSLLATSSSAAQPSQLLAGSAHAAGSTDSCDHPSLERDQTTRAMPSSRPQQQDDVASVTGFRGRIHSQMKVASLATGLSLGAVAAAHAETSLPLTTALLAAEASVSPILSLPEGLAMPEGLSFDQLPLLLSSLPALVGLEMALPALTLPALDFSMPALSLPTTLALPEILLSPPTNGQVVAAASGLIALALTPIQGAWNAIQLSPDAPLESFFFYLSLAILLTIFLSQPKQ